MEDKSDTRINMKRDEDKITLSKSTVYLGVIGILVLILFASVFTQGFGIIKQPAASIGSSVPTVTEGIMCLAMHLAFQGHNLQQYRLPQTEMVL